MPKIFKCPYCDTPPQRMREDAETCGSYRCVKRRQRKKKKEGKNDCGVNSRD